MKTIAQQLNVTEFPFIIKDKNGNEIYHEDSRGQYVKMEFDSNNNQTYYYNWIFSVWWRREYDSSGKCIYFENHAGRIHDLRSNVPVDTQPKPCEGKVVEVDGIKYKLVKA